MAVYALIHRSLKVSDSWGKFISTGGFQPILRVAHHPEKEKKIVEDTYKKAKKKMLPGLVCSYNATKQT